MDYLLFHASDPSVSGNLDSLTWSDLAMHYASEIQTELRQNHIPVGHIYSGRQISGKFCLQSRSGNSGFEVYFPVRKAHQEGLGYLDRFLAWLYNHRGQTEDAPGELE